MLNQEEVDAFKKAWYTFEEIQSIQEWIKDIEEWNIYTQEEVDNYINNTLFAKYKVHV